MIKFAVKIDLGAFFNNSYEKVMILVDPEWQNVSKLEKRLKKIFKIDCDISFKSNEGFFIPSEEPVEILKYVEILIAFPTNKLHKEKNLSANNNIQEEDNKSKNEDPAPSDILHKKKRTHLMMNETNFTTSTPAAHLAKRIKGNNANSSSANSVSVSPLSNLDNLSAITNIICVNEEKKHKSIRKTTNNEISTKDQNPQTNELAFTFKEPNGCVSETNSRSHIHYNDSGMELNEVNEKDAAPKKEIVFCCDLENSDQKNGRIFEIGQKHQTEPVIYKRNTKISLKDIPKPVIILENIKIANKKNKDDTEEIPQHNTKNSDKNENFTQNTEGKSVLVELQASEYTESLISCDESAVIELNETENETSNETKSSAEINKTSFVDSEEEDNIKKLLSKAIALKELPNTNDLVIFKILLSNNKPSDYFVGKCEYVNRRSKTIKLFLMEGLSQTKFMPPKYACNIDDSIDFKTINVKFQDLIDPRVTKT